MTQPHSYLVRMLVFVAVVAGACALLWQRLLEVFLANPAINGLIAGVLAIGVLYTFHRVVRLGPEVAWLLSFRRGEPGLTVPRRTALLAPMMGLLGERTGPMSLTPAAMRSILDSVGSRLDESRDISRYLIGLLIFLGLLGTFWGLLDTVTAVGQTIGSLSLGDGPSEEAFARLQAGLEAPLAGMGTAFSSSLFGLAGSLVLGFLDLQAAQAQNRFYNDFEEWLSTVTRIQAQEGRLFDEEASSPAYVSALLEQMADNFGALERSLARTEEARMQANSQMLDVAQRLASTTELLRGEHRAITGLAETQSDLRPVYDRLAQALETRGAGLPDAVEGHIRSLDLSLRQLLEEQADARSQMLSEIKFELKLLRKTLQGVMTPARPRAPGASAGEEAADESRDG